MYYLKDQSDQNKPNDKVTEELKMKLTLGVFDSHLELIQYNYTEFTSTQRLIFNIGFNSIDALLDNCLESSVLWFSIFDKAMQGLGYDLQFSFPEEWNQTKADDCLITWILNKNPDKNLTRFFLYILMWKMICIYFIHSPGYLSLCLIRARKCNIHTQT